MSTEIPIARFGQDWRPMLQKAIDQLPDQVDVPYEKTPQGDRDRQFRAVCPAGFTAPIERRMLRSPAAFDRVAGWGGKFPGPIALGATGTAKTRAAWTALRHLFVEQGRPFEWFPVRRLMTTMEKYEEDGATEEFFRVRSLYRVLMVDDVDKINWDFQSQVNLLFAFYDWIYRSQQPCITTTNKDRSWWANKMGEAFARRLFDDAHFEVKF